MNPKNLVHPFSAIQTVDDDFVVSEFDGMINVNTTAYDVEIDIAYYNSPNTIENVQISKDGTLYSVRFCKIITIKKTNEGVGRVKIKSSS